MVVILVCCQSVVPSMSLLKEDLGRTHRNKTAWVVLKNMQRAKSQFLTPDVPILHAQPVGWYGTEKFGLLNNALLDDSRV